MNCDECGKEKQESDIEYPHCGAPQDKAQEPSDKNEVVLLAKRAMCGDDSVWGEIYEKTNRYVYFMALKFLSAEQDAQDIAQEVYIQAIRSIGQLYAAESFFGWIRSIIFSKCKDLVKKKKPVLLDDDEDGGSPLDDIPEIGENFIPDMALDSAETRRMILELIDALPYAQRQAVLFFYYDEMTIDQIAAVMECPTGTVKSRLNYARQQIKKGVEEHEKKGVKLYGAAALPILSILLREQAQALPIPPALSGGLAPILGQAAGAVASTVATGSSAASNVGTAAVSTAKTAVPTLTKVIIGTLVTGMVIGGGIMLLMINQDDDITPPPPVTATVMTDAASTVTDEGAQGVLPSGNDDETDGADEAEEEIEPEPDTRKNDPYYDSLSDEQKQMLSRLEAAMRASDYTAAMGIHSSDESHTIYDAIPGWGAFWYYPDEETSVFIHRDDGSEKTYNATMYMGNDGNGRFCIGTYHIDPFVGFEGNIFMMAPTYVLTETSYVNGKAEGPFIINDLGYYDHPAENLVLQQVRGNLRAGAAYGPIENWRDGEFKSSGDDYPPEALNWWPDWPE